MKVLTVMGTRPEAIKLAPVVRALAQCAQRVQSIVCITAQHRQMLDQVLDLFHIQPAYDLDLMKENQTPSQVAAGVLSQIEAIFYGEKPDWVLVQGDTTTAAAAALAAFYARIKVAHVEAGLRTHDKWQPFPEEINRRIISVIADLNLAPTEHSRFNLLQEGIPKQRVVVTGNTVIDALGWIAVQPATPAIDDLLRRINPADRRMILVTAHRRENWGQPLESICTALRAIAVRFEGRVQIIYPVHLNPLVWGPVHQLLGQIPGITLLPPVDYLTLVHLMKRAFLVLTDSGGIQEEAPALGKPVLILRQITERPEGVEAGIAKVIGTDQMRITQEVAQLLEDEISYRKMARAANPYGDGRASLRIVAALLGEPIAPFRPGNSGI